MINFRRVFEPDKDCSHNDEVKPKIETTHYQLVFTCTAKLGENHETTCNHRSTHQDWFTALFISIEWAVCRMRTVCLG